MTDCSVNCVGVQYDVCITSGRAWPLCLLVKDPDGNPIDLSGKAFVLTIKRDARDASPLLQITSMSGRITVHPSGEVGALSAELTEAETAALAAETHVAVWSLSMEPGLGTAEASDLLGGKVQIKRGV